MFGQKSKLLRIYRDQSWERAQVIDALYEYISDTEDTPRPIEAYVPPHLGAQARFALNHWRRFVADAAEVDASPKEPRKVTVHFVEGPWAGQTYEADRVVGPLFAVGHEIGNHYWLDTNSSPPTYHWNDA